MADHKTVDYEDLAKRIMFGVVNPEKEGLVYRKDKSAADVIKKRALAQKKSNYETNNAIGYLEIYLQGIFKKRLKVSK